LKRQSKEINPDVSTLIQALIAVKNVIEEEEKKMKKPKLKLRRRLRIDHKLKKHWRYIEWLKQYMRLRV